MTAAVAMAGSSNFNGGSFTESLGNVEGSSFRADSHAPIGVMGDHRHKAAEFMLSYRYMNMHMDQNYMGTNKVSPAEVRAQGFMVSPTEMDMEMHMVGMMYAPTDRVTLMAMVNFVEMTMDHEMMSGGTFTTKSNGLGDSSLGALIGLYDDERSHLHLGLSVLLPTAEVDEEDFIPLAGMETQLPYPMQLGAGSWGGKLALTWYSLQQGWSYGGQASALTYFDDNDQGYKLGDRYEASAWIAKPIGENLSVSLRTNYSNWGDIDGTDKDLVVPLGAVPTARTDLRGGSALDLSVGVNFYETRSGLRFAGEYGQRVWQDLDGPQLGVDSWTTLGIQYAW